MRKYLLCFVLMGSGVPKNALANKCVREMRNFYSYDFKTSVKMCRAGACVVDEMTQNAWTYKEAYAMCHVDTLKPQRKKKGKTKWAKRREGRK